MYSCRAGVFVKRARGGIFRKQNRGGRGVAAMRKCWYPSCILVKNRVSADSGISVSVFLLDNLD